MPLTQLSGLSAQELFNGLLEGETYVTVPAVDLASPTYSLPPKTSDIHTPIARLSEAALTSRQVAGTGLFDGLMVSLGAHLKNEFTQNRITGQEYTKAYIALVEAALGTATQYLIASEQAFWQSRLAQEQAKVIETQLVTEAVNLSLAKTKLAAAQVEVSNMEATFALTKMKLASEDAAFRATEAQVSQANYQLTYTLPAQKDLLLSQKDSAVAQTAQTSYQTTNILPAQKTLINEQVETARAQTLDTRSDGQAVVGSVGKQKALYTQQIESYKRDAEYKVAKLYHDTWTVSKTMDEGWATPGSLNETRIDEIIGQLRARVGYV